MKDQDLPYQATDIKTDVLDLSEDEKDRPRYQVTPKSDSLRAMVELTNIAEKLSDEDLNKIGGDAKQGYLYDLESRREWEENIDEWMRS